jgi:hypothetical protein
MERWKFTREFKLEAVKQASPSNRGRLGDTYAFVALDPETKLIPLY